MKAFFEFILEHIHRPENLLLGSLVILFGWQFIRGGKYVIARGYFFPSVIRKGRTESVPQEKVAGEPAQKEGRGFIIAGVLAIMFGIFIMLAAFVS
ncbi:MAG: hypothetical protein JXB38_14090 [Anaerolineales bacterium]|nr:hypothetical protein [Anaerolineales bacterium]